MAALDDDWPAHRRTLSLKTAGCVGDRQVNNMMYRNP